MARRDKRAWRLNHDNDNRASFIYRVFEKAFEICSNRAGARGNIGKVKGS